MKLRKWLDSVLRLAVIVFTALLAFKIGVHYGENKVGDAPESRPIAEPEAMASIEDYLKTSDASFHFQKVIDTDTPGEKQYLYILDEAPASAGAIASVKRASPPAAAALQVEQGKK